MIEIHVLEKSGKFAENKDVSREIRIREIWPALERNEEVVLNFEGVEAATQSFIHALISDILRKQGDRALERMSFKSCNETVRKIIGIVVTYMQEGA